MRSLIICFLVLAFYQKGNAQDQLSLKKADSLFAIGQFSQAIELYQKTTPFSQEVLLKLAQANRAKGLYNIALNFYDQLASSYPEQYLASLEYAKLLITLKQFQKADSLLIHIIEADSLNPDLFYRSGLVKKELNDSTYLKKFQKAFRLDSTHQKSCFELAKYYLKQRRFSKVEQIAKIGLISYPENPELLNILGQNFLLREFYEEAIPFFEKLIALNHKNEFVHASLALCYQKNYEPKKAIEQYEMALGYDANNPLRIERMARCYQDLEDHENARKWYRSALDLKQIPLEDSYLYIAITYRLQKNWPEAINFTKKAIQENPNFRRAYYQLALYADEFYKDPEKVIPYYQDYKNRFGSNDETKFFMKIIDKRIAELEEELDKKTASE